MLKKILQSKYFHNTIWIFLEKFSRLFANFFVTIYIARYLLPENFGILNFSLSLVALMSAVAMLGLNNIVVKSIVRKERTRELVLISAFILKLCMSIVCVLILYIFVSNTQVNSLQNNLTLVVSFALIFQSTNVVDYYFQSFVQSKYVVISQLIQLFFGSVFKIVLIYFQASLIWFGFALLLDSIILATSLTIFFLPVLKQSIVIFEFSKNWRRICKISKILVKNSWPLLLSSLSISLYMRMDQVMIGYMLGSSSVGLYAAASRISEGLYVISGSVMMSMFPAILSKNISDEIFNKRIHAFYGGLIWTSIVASIVVAYFAVDIMDIVFGSSYSSSSGVLIIHVWSTVFVAIGLVSTRWHIAKNLQIYVTINTVVGAILNIILNYILIPIYGIEGAALSTLVSYFIAGLGMNMVHRKTRENFKHILAGALFRI